MYVHTVLCYCTVRYAGNMQFIRQMSCQDGRLRVLQPRDVPVGFRMVLHILHSMYRTRTALYCTVASPGDAARDVGQLGHPSVCHRKLLWNRHFLPRSVASPPLLLKKKKKKKGGTHFALGPVHDVHDAPPASLRGGTEEKRPAYSYSRTWLWLWFWFNKL